MPDDSAYAPFSIARHADGTRVELGRGAMGITYRATDTQLGRTVALKVINATYLGHPVARQRFLREARAAAQLHHANVAGVFQLRADGEDVFYAMEFVEGETIEAYVRRRGPLPWRLAVRIILQAAQGLAAANERGLIHRDIKPANLMLARGPAEGADEEDDGLRVKVIDFGLAKSLGRTRRAANSPQNLGGPGEGGRPPPVPQGETGMVLAVASAGFYPVHPTETGGGRSGGTPTPAGGTLALPGTPEAPQNPRPVGRGGR